MDQDEEFMRWIMNSHPLENVEGFAPSASLYQPAVPAPADPNHLPPALPPSTSQPIPPAAQQQQQPNQPVPDNYYQQGYYPPYFPAQHVSPPFEQHPDFSLSEAHGLDDTLGTSAEDQYTDAQLKAMTSKERRQLRNKISARNFRNRRKEYIASLEGEVAKFKNENSQLRLEIKWVRTTLVKLQKENDHLRVELALCQSGITKTKADKPNSSSDSYKAESPSSSPSAGHLSSQSNSPIPTGHHHQHPLPSLSSRQTKALSTSPALPPSLVPSGPRSYGNHSDSSFSPPPNTKTEMVDHWNPAMPLNQQEYIYGPPAQAEPTCDVYTPAAPQQQQQPMMANTSLAPATHAIPTTTVPVQTSMYAPLAYSVPQQQQQTNHVSPPSASVTPAYPPPPTTRPIQLPVQHHYPAPVYHQPHPHTYTDATDSDQSHMVPRHAHARVAHPAPPSHVTDRSVYPHPSQYHLSHAMFPEVDLTELLGKTRQPGADDAKLFRQYPLLAPALLSMVVQHTMSLSTDQLMHHAKLLNTKTTHVSPPSTPLPPANAIKPDVKPCFIPGLAHTKLARPLTKKQVRVLWESLLDQMLQVANDTRCMAKQEDAPLSTTVSAMDSASYYERYRQFYNDNDEEDDEIMPWYDAPATGFQAICPLYWLQRQFCKFVITYVVVKYPQLDAPCRSYLPICERYRLITN
ncbi:hypothetical protein DM01DRAFT_1407637 [Hesseltinella vesiculosa]|uniref:BZIP domain-containing protein n=1 Tax=Hesseltinella vesiculosa TaxID=101127 RepID=A0A1X2GHZ7_9FUNG|nr:hypothetical protein DM01DRAFT_1407637 [Hesseltinella vesiculosa]